MDVFIGTRMHSNIFALISKVPVVAIEYEHKTRGIMRDLGLEHLTVAIEEAQFPNLKEKVDDLIKNCQQYKQTIIDNLPLLIKKGQLAIEVIKDDYEQNAKNLE
jgi:colanic acid/amylovoran biosynthesis protein